MIHFLQITIQEKDRNDYRSFLDWADSKTMMVYQLRGYGDSPSMAAGNAYAKFNDEDRHDYITDEWEWKNES
jgi:hypothetical protein